MSHHTHLDPAERAKLAEANRLLAEVTRPHDHTCRCTLCEARALTDVQGEAAFHVRCVLPPEG